MTCVLKASWMMYRVIETVGTKMAFLDQWYKPDEWRKINDPFAHQFVGHAYEQDTEAALSLTSRSLPLTSLFSCNGRNEIFSYFLSRSTERPFVPLGVWRILMLRELCGPVRGSVETFRRGWSTYMWLACALQPTPTRGISQNPKRK